MERIPPEVRILPMNRQKEFTQCKSVEDVQEQFFLDELPSRDNCGYLLYTGLKAEPDTIILFQSDCSIIASAVLCNYQRFQRPDSDGYKGCLFLERNSIRVFDPVPESTIIGIRPNVKQLGQVKWYLNPKGYAVFESILHNVRMWPGTFTP